MILHHLSYTSSHTKYSLPKHARGAPLMIQIMPPSRRPLLLGSTLRMVKSTKVISKTSLLKVVGVTWFFFHVL